SGTHRPRADISTLSERKGDSSQEGFARGQDPEGCSTPHESSGEGARGRPLPLTRLLDNINLLIVLLWSHHEHHRVAQSWFDGVRRFATGPDHPGPHPPPFSQTSPTPRKRDRSSSARHRTLPAAPVDNELVTVGGHALKVRTACDPGRDRPGNTVE